MNIKKIFMSIIVALFFLTGCSKDPYAKIDENKKNESTHLVEKKDREIEEWDYPYFPDGTFEEMSEEVKEKKADSLAGFLSSSEIDNIINKPVPEPVEAKELAGTYTLTTSRMIKINPDHRYYEARFTTEDLPKEDWPEELEVDEYHILDIKEDGRFTTYSYLKPIIKYDEEKSQIYRDYFDSWSGEKHREYFIENKLEQRMLYVSENNELKHLEGPVVDFINVHSGVIEQENNEYSLRSITGNSLLLSIDRNGRYYLSDLYPEHYKPYSTQSIRGVIEKYGSGIVVIDEKTNSEDDDLGSEEEVKTEIVYEFDKGTGNEAAEFFRVDDGFFPSSHQLHLKERELLEQRLTDNGSIRDGITLDEYESLVGIEHYEDATLFNINEAVQHGNFGEGVPIKVEEGTPEYNFIPYGSEEITPDYVITVSEAWVQNEARGTQSYTNATYVYIDHQLWEYD